MNPFLIFPELIWEMILKQVEDPKDVLNTLKAFPELEKRFQKKKPLWLFGQVIPHVLEYVDEPTTNTLLNLRRVCRRWQVATDKIFQGCSELVAETPGGNIKVAGVTFIQDKFFPECTYEMYKGKVPCPGDTFFDYDEETTVSEFLTDMEKYPGRNPFPGRSVVFDFDIDPEDEVVLREDLIKAYWEAVFKIFNTFGEHVHQVAVDTNISLEGVHNFDNDHIIWKSFLKSLNLLPNLKILRIDGSIARFYNEEGEEWQYLFPTLPGLEEINIIVPELESPFMDKPYMTRFLKYYGTQLQRLFVSHLSSKFTNAFPNLKELKLDSINVRDNPKETLLKWESPLLTHLSIQFLETKRSIGIEDLVFDLLKKFPYLRKLSVKRDCENYCPPFEEKCFARRNEIFPLLEVFEFEDDLSQLYDWIGCFPNLIHFIIKTHNRPQVIDFSVNNNIRIRDQIQSGKMYASNVWHVLRKLETVILETVVENIGGQVKFTDTKDFIFTRSAYERLKVRGINVSMCAPLRQGIVTFLSGNGEADESNDNDRVGRAPVFFRNLFGLAEENYGDEVDSDESENSENEDENDSNNDEESEESN